MRFKVQAADPETGEEVLWEIEAPTVQAARQRANDSGYLVGRVRPCSDSGSHADNPASQASAREPFPNELPSTGTQTDISNLSEGSSRPASTELSTANWIARSSAIEQLCFYAAIIVTFISFVAAGKSRWERYEDWEFSRAFGRGLLPCLILILSTAWLWATEAASINRAEFEWRFDHPRRMSILAALALSVAMSFVFDPWDEDAGRSPTRMLFGFVTPFAMLLVITVLWAAWLPNAIVECRGTRVLRRMRGLSQGDRPPTITGLEGGDQPGRPSHELTTVAEIPPSASASNAIEAARPPVDSAQSGPEASNGPAPAIGEREVSDAGQNAFWPTGGRKWQPPGTSARAVLCAALCLASATVVQMVLQIPSSVKLVPDQTANALWHGAIITVEMCAAIWWPMWLYGKMQKRASESRFEMVRRSLACAGCLGEFAEGEPKHIEASRAFKCDVAYCLKCRPSRV